MIKENKRGPRSRAGLIAPPPFAPYESPTECYNIKKRRFSTDSTGSKADEKWRSATWIRVSFISHAENHLTRFSSLISRKKLLRKNFRDSFSR
jgi:hypothetical protein